MKAWFRSIRWRLQAWYGLVLWVVLVAFGCTAFLLARENRLRRIDQALEERLSMLMDSMRPGPMRERRAGPGGGRPGPGPRWMEERGEFEGLNPDALRGWRLSPEQAGRFTAGFDEMFYYVIWLPTGERVQASDGAPTDVPMPEAYGRGPQRGARTRGDLREMTLANGRGLRMVVGRSMVTDLAELRHLAWMLMLVGGGVLVLGLAGGWWVATRAIRPIAAISATAHRMTAGSLDQRISVGDTDSELGQLAQVLNATFDRLQAAFARQTRFTADASHELRTPVTVLLSQTQTALSRERTAADYRETLVVCQRTAQRMRQLTESLLALARLDDDTLETRAERCDMQSLAREVVELLRPLATEHRIRLHSELSEAACLGDPHQLSQVLTNLVSNAIAYNHPDGEVAVRVSVNGHDVAVVVADTGQGIAPEHCAQVFERFYRVDPARARAQGHTGLGLAIAKSIVERHGGTIGVTSSEGRGSTFTVRLPLAPDPGPGTPRPKG